MGDFTSNVLAIWWVLPASLGIAITANTLAMEGAVMFAPAFLLLFPALSGTFPQLTPNEAIGVSLLIMFFGTASASMGYVRQRVVDFRLAARLLIITIPCAILARSVSFLIPSWLLFIVFGSVLLLLAFTVLRSIIVRRGTERNINRPGVASTVASPLASRENANSEIMARDGRKYSYLARFNWRDRAYTGAGGALVGLIGVGVGAIVTTTLIVRHDMPARVAVATTVIVVSATVLAGSLTHLVVASVSGSTVAFEWTLVILAVPGVIIGGQIAPHISARCPERTLKIALLLMFALMSSVMIFRSVVSL
ncbi:MAG: hypothetical protein BZY79_03085 [SAR202 cluster bacterium Casp-Chloro-G4]|nr:sulfite exporter TauE/SafE family protein [Chloroflexota bacterium]MDA1227750.1 sulfite exporter TauE/SafE family protein [Chloroflexota bacterium]PKB61551.1 MAG: hypothetical protein BZY79_03085 [SAR202 cluster bacterium Casp-Chloro-G4]